MTKAKCWRGKNILTSGKADLEIFVPAGKSVSLHQTKFIEIPLFGHFRFTLNAATKNVGDVAEVRLFIAQKKENEDNILLEKLSKVFAIDSREQFMSTKFNIDQEAEEIKFEILFEGEKDITVKVSNIETILSVNNLHIIILLLSAIWFAAVAYISLLMLGKKKNEQSQQLLSEGENIFAFGVKLMQNSLMNCYNNRDFFEYIMSNIFWGCGFSVFNTLVLIYLEDKYAMSSSKLAMTFLLLCISIILGAWLSYILERKIDRWNTALIFFGIWIINPFFLCFMSGTSLFATAMLCVYYGITIGVIYSLKYSIFANIIPESREGEYMGILYFSTKLVELAGSLLVVAAFQLANFLTILVVSSMFFLLAYAVLIPFVMRGKKTGDMELLENELPVKKDNNSTDESIPLKTNKNSIDSEAGDV